MIHVFDLDGTVIDSSHRKLTRADGSLDLDHWRENCTAHKIARDTLLPLADHWRKLYQQGETIAICTARVMSRHDWNFLGRHGLTFHHALARDGEMDTRSDLELKHAKIRTLCASRGFIPWDVVLYEDNRAVLSMARKMGCRVVDSTLANAHTIRQRELRERIT